nr:hypothetical protein [Tanacetum cinerariifolium]
GRARHRPARSSRRSYGYRVRVAGGAQPHLEFSGSHRQLRALPAGVHAGPAVFRCGLAIGLHRAGHLWLVGVAAAAAPKPRRCVCPRCRLPVCHAYRCGVAVLRQHHHGHQPSGAVPAFAPQNRKLAALDRRRCGVRGHLLAPRLGAYQPALRRERTIMSATPLRISITGPESAGKSTLAAELAAHYGTVFVPEYAREYLEANGPAYTLADLEAIARAQLAEEELPVVPSQGLLFCDTDLLVIKIWAENAFGTCPAWVLAELEKPRYVLTLLLAPDLPWTPDPLREH